MQLVFDRSQWFIHGNSMKTFQCQETRSDEVQTKFTNIDECYDKKIESKERWELIDLLIIIQQAGEKVRLQWLLQITLSWSACN